MTLKQSPSQKKRGGRVLRINATSLNANLTASQLCCNDGNLQFCDKKEKLKPTFYQKTLLKDFFKVCVKLKSISRPFRDVMERLIDCWTPHGCFPSHADIAADTGLSDRTVRNVLREAELRGWISWTNCRKGRRQTSNRYVFHLKNKMIQAVLDGFSEVKEKSAEIRDFFRRKNFPPSAYFYLNRKRTSMNLAVTQIKKTFWKEIVENSNGNKGNKNFLQPFGERKAEKVQKFSGTIQRESAWQKLFRENPSEAMRVFEK